MSRPAPQSHGETLVEGGSLQSYRAEGEVQVSGTSNWSCVGRRRQRLGPE